MVIIARDVEKHEKRSHADKFACPPAGETQNRDDERKSAGDSNHADSSESEEDDLDDWSVDDVSTWLRETVKLPQYCTRFSEVGIDGVMLSEATDADLQKDLDVSNEAHRAKILKERQKLLKTVSNYGTIS